MNVSCIIPAWNEGERVAGVLGAVLQHPLVNEVIVVDDGSTDGTREVLAGFSFRNLCVIRHERNQGKTRAIATGIAAASGALLLFLDADLIGLTEDDVTTLLTPVLEKRAEISISLRGNAPWFWRAIGLDYLSGERVIPRTLIEPYLAKLGTLSAFGLEVYMNTIIIRNNLRIKIVPLPHVASPYKIRKHGLLRGAFGELRMLRDIFRVITPAHAIRQILALRRLRVG